MSVNPTPARADQAAELEQRLVSFAAGITRLDRTLAGRHGAGPIVRSGNSVAPNCAEARSAEDRADFVHKRRSAIKELNETAGGLQIVVASDLDSPEAVRPLADECAALQRILGASRRTVRANASALAPDPGPRWPAPIDQQQATANNH